MKLKLTVLLRIALYKKPPVQINPLVSTDSGVWLPYRTIFAQVPNTKEINRRKKTLKNLFRGDGKKECPQDRGEDVVKRMRTGSDAETPDCV